MLRYLLNILSEFVIIKVINLINLSSVGLKQVKYQDRVGFTSIKNETGPGRDQVGTGSGPGFVTVDRQNYPLSRSHSMMNE